jgi:hypothetical protein
LLATQSWNASSDAQRVNTNQRRLPSVGRRSRNSSNPGEFSTAPARLAKRSWNASSIPSGTSTLLIFTTLTSFEPYDAGSSTLKPELSRGER